MNLRQEANVIQDTCGRPCDPDNDCPDCTPYWQRMVDEGLWDDTTHSWTDEGWREILRHI